MTDAKFVVKTIPLREFQREEVKALGAGFSAEPLLLTGRDREFVLLPPAWLPRLLQIALHEPEPEPWPRQRPIAR